MLTWLFCRHSGFIVQSQLQDTVVIWGEGGEGERGERGERMSVKIL